VTLFERHSATEFDQPLLVVALEGWVDAGLGAAGAIAALLASGKTELVATFDGEVLIDRRARRPIARIVNGVTEHLTWPTIELRSGHDLAGAEILYLVGPEPDFKWRSFVSSVTDLSAELGVRMAVGLGAFPAPAPHTRPVKLAATAPGESSSMSAGIGVVQGAIEVPSGVWGALELAFGAAGIPAVGLWARVPHYVTGMTFAPASAALVEGLATLADLSLDTTELRTAADASLRQVDELITKSSEHLELVRQLERNLDATEGNPLDLGQIPTADELGAELERYLRGERSDRETEREHEHEPELDIDLELDPELHVELDGDTGMDWDLETDEGPDLDDDEGDQNA
jgi:hypothetical protein